MEPGNTISEPRMIKPRHAYHDVLSLGHSKPNIDQSVVSPRDRLSGLLDDLEKHRIMTFPTSSQLRDAVADPVIAMEPENEAFRFIENNDRRLFQSFQGLFRCTVRFRRCESLISKVPLGATWWNRLPSKLSVKYVCCLILSRDFGF